ncbi:alpha/beta hydrolase [Aureisphaera galaxeae]|uniref:alpha/beta fold hydrolase n=1 Tax=Aureisphaera galaxeae TaxID=1538023 RepID=UPI002350883F|nr:alpha/beta hydrolase [Aureisphaera galaxeae]MDC8003635.1 alpha/beta hydrolase [Aureisphaera galaxeae]
MNTEKIPIYFVPGLAASKEIFRNIRLPEDRYEIHILEWLIPEKEETIQQYAKRMADRIEHQNAVLVGVSFGGVMVQEMSQFLDLRALVIISSVKTKNELPARFRWVRNTGAYKLLPTGWALSVKDLTKLAIGPRSKKRLTLYQEYLSVRDKQYLDWAIKQMVCWERTEKVPGVHHIHGDGDIVFPSKNISEYTLLEGGTHVMILNKGSKVSKLLENIIETG